MREKQGESIKNKRHDNQREHDVMMRPADGGDAHHQKPADRHLRKHKVTANKLAQKYSA